MKNYQSERYEALLHYIEANLKQTITARQVTQQAHYSYRNMNRIFQALKGETIGKYIRRRKIEKAAEYLVYSDHTISDIADELGFTDIATFSKAFKKKFGYSPSDFRGLSGVYKNQQPEEVLTHKAQASDLTFEIEKLPSFPYLYFEYHGDYQDHQSMEKLWGAFLEFCEAHDLINEESIFFGEILDDDEITESIFCRYRACLILERPFNPNVDKRAYLAQHAKHKYAKFICQGNDNNTEQFYQHIYAQWIPLVQREFADLPTLEFYHDIFEEKGESLTEIYIPIE